MERLIALLCGLVFGAGLIESEMVNPMRVLSFLDVAGNWNPALGFVMASALAITIPGFFLLRRRQSNLLGGKLNWPTATDIARKLVLGAVMFGLGWGIAGLCPAPALVALKTNSAAIWVFVGSMCVGMKLQALISSPTITRADKDAQARNESV